MHPCPISGLAIVMVGLPARGKTHIARKIDRYFGWLGYRSKVFNVGQYRRSSLGGRQPHSFFDPNNNDGVAARTQLAAHARDDLIDWLTHKGQVGIYDATNSTVARRSVLKSAFSQHGIQVIFVESLCTDAGLIRQNVLQTKLRSPDYEGVSEADALSDFRRRIQHYEAAYETITDADGAYIKLFDVREKLIIRGIQGYLPSRLVFFLMNLHITPRRIWLTRHGESEWNVLGKLGGNSPISPLGEDYAKALGQFFNEAEFQQARVITSTLLRTQQTAQHLTQDTESVPALNEIRAGSYEGMTYAQIEKKHPAEFQARSNDKLRYRYPDGESYTDLIERLEPVILEIEREQRDIIVVAHQAVLRCLIAYFRETPLKDAPFLSVPLHTLICLTPTAYSCDEALFSLLPLKQAPS